MHAVANGNPEVFTSLKKSWLKSDDYLVLEGEEPKITHLEAVLLFNRLILDEQSSYKRQISSELDPS